MADETGVDRLLEDVRRQLNWRPTPADLDGVVAGGGLIVDIRPIEQRSRDGELPGALVIDRNVLEWRLDPAGTHRIPEAGDPDQVIVLVCHEGYASSLAALSLRQIGLRHATDLDGGYQAWLAYQPRSTHS